MQTFLEHSTEVSEGLLNAETHVDLGTITRQL